MHMTLLMSHGGVNTECPINGGMLPHDRISGGVSICFLKTNTESGVLCINSLGWCGLSHYTYTEGAELKLHRHLNSGIS